MKLYDVPNNTMIRLSNPENGPPDSIEPRIGGEYMFKHIDGMYSLCYDHVGRIIHLPAWAEVEVIK